MTDRMSFRRNLHAESLAALCAAMAVGHPYVDAFGRAYDPAPRGVKREGICRRQGTFSKQRVACRKAHRALIGLGDINATGAIRSRYSSRRVNVQERPVSASLAAWRSEQPALATFGFDAYGRVEWS